ncbi:MAG: NAD(P)-binding domain-containing protein [Acidobacteriota bacterium]|nr:NAD(P)-binding domain-containing protein [Acidobacteriota bacterium]
MTTSSPHVHDYLILGAGPSGLQLAYFFQKSGFDYLMLEAGDQPGHFFRTHPRHRMLISINKVHTGYDHKDLNLRYDWNSLLCDNDDLLFPKYTKRFFPDADVLCRYLVDFADHYGLNMSLNTRIGRVERGTDDLFSLTAEDGRVFKGRRLVVAAGFTKPYVPDIPGIELAENYTEMSVDPEDYEGQSVLILGKGNSAFETAENLMETTSLIHMCSPHHLRFAWQTKYVGDLRAVNNNLLDTYQLKSQNAVLDAHVTDIRKEDGKFVVDLRYSYAQDERVTHRYDRVLVCTGFRFDPSIFAENCRPELVIKDRFPKLTSAWETVGVPHMYFAGVLTHSRDFKKTTSAFIHGFRYNSRALFHLLADRYHGTPWPCRELPADASAITDAVMERINTASGLWQQFGFLSDMITLDGDGNVRYHEEIPTEFLADNQPGVDGYVTLSLEFGSKPKDVFQIERRPEDEDFAANSPFLHPVLRLFRKGELVDTLHILEDLFGQWKDEERHMGPIRKFLNGALGDTPEDEPVDETMAAVG